AHRLNARGHAALPTNTEIESALVAHQSLFGREQHDRHIHELRHAALAAMQLLDEFSPRLVGPVLAGTATHSSPVNLHAFSDTPEAVMMCLAGHGFDVASYERRLKSRRDSVVTYPGYRFRLNANTVETTVFTYNGLRQAPISPVDGRPMRRATREQVAELAAPIGKRGQVYFS
ncbi:MAG: hypothetical protein AAFX10_12525, partial [Pseudomonadota bacterium]